MPANNNLAKIQHYVPQFILKNFTTGKKPQLFVFDKAKGAVFKTNVKNVASEQGFYNFDIDGSEYSLEGFLGSLEKETSYIIKKIVEEESLAKVTGDERFILSFFIAVQFLRVKQSRITLSHLDIALGDKLKAMGLNLDEIENFSISSEEEIKEISIKNIIHSVEFIPYIYDKVWMLFKVSSQSSYYISDNPITLQNRTALGPLGNLGIGVKGIEIYFPISSSLSLGIFCRSHEEKIRRDYQEYKNSLDKLEPELVPILRMMLPPKVEELIAGMDKGTVIHSIKENVINHNSLQVMYSSRFVYSDTDDFDLVRQMIKKNPLLKQAPMPKVY